MEITQKMKMERFAYTTTINEAEATCTIMMRDDVRRGASVEFGSISLRKPDGKVNVNISGDKDSLPEDLAGTLDSLEAFLDECIAKHETVTETAEVVEE